eukprot:TRINITY_DN5241_c0_g1_i1.p1 TRINITY_DN5241_c0_g1~~TRINITY_DN5241_c0_g1_i1.p1  ORF type:complete len:347 (-),score=67.47 TRINITY_DN5241_c0_g1_i1:582-1622(-)
MGNCVAGGPPVDKEQMKKSKQIDKDIKKRPLEHKLLLLGAGESGKSTFFKQLKLLTEEYDDEERKQWSNFARSDCIACMQSMVKAAIKLGKQVSPENMDAAAEVEGAPEGRWTRELGLRVKQLWADPVIRDIFNQRDQAFQLNDSAEFLFTNIDRLLDDTYQASNEDIIRTRVRTTGITEAQFNFNTWSFRMIDVGGQRGERRKWIHCFDAVTCVVYCVSLAEYNQKLREAEETNRMEESLRLFAGTTNSPWFWKIPIILFFNKSDVFNDKLKTVPLKTCFPQYTGPNEFLPAAEYIREQFLALNEAPHQIHPHFTTAIDPENVRVIFLGVKETILKISLESSNLL